jgi:hypothetical protein
VIVIRYAVAAAIMVGPSLLIFGAFSLIRWALRGGDDDRK